MTMTSMALGKVPHTLLRVLFWGTFVCVPASMGLFRFQTLSMGRSNAIPAEIPEIDALSKEVQETHKNAVKDAETAALGMKFAEDKHTQPLNPAGTKMGEFEDLVSFVSKTQAQQMAALKERTQKIVELSGTVAVLEDELKVVRQLLQKNEEQLSQSMKKIQQIEAKVQEKAQRDTQNTQRVSKLFSTMTPDKVSKIVETMDDDILASILLNMKEKDVAQILAMIPTKRAASVALKLGAFPEKKR